MTNWENYVANPYDTTPTPGVYAMCGSARQGLCIQLDVDPIADPHPDCPDEGFVVYVNDEPCERVARTVFEGQLITISTAKKMVQEILKQ